MLCFLRVEKLSSVVFVFGRMKSQYGIPAVDLLRRVLSRRGLELATMLSTALAFNAEVQRTRFVG